MFAKLTTSYSTKQFDRLTAFVLEQYQSRAITRMQLCGEKFIANARQSGSYKDITGNLRSSIGYVVLNVGEQVKFQLSEEVSGKGRKESNKAKKQAKELIEKLKSKYPLGVVLICFAAMDYAIAVESKGKDVITGSVFQLKSDLKELFKSVKSSVSL